MTRRGMRLAVACGLVAGMLIGLDVSGLASVAGAIILREVLA